MKHDFVQLLASQHRCQNYCTLSKRMVGEFHFVFSFLKPSRAESIPQLGCLEMICPKLPSTGVESARVPEACARCFWLCVLIPLPEGQFRVPWSACLVVFSPPTVLCCFVVIHKASFRINHLKPPLSHHFGISSEQKPDVSSFNKQKPDPHAPGI